MTEVAPLIPGGYKGLIHVRVIANLELRDFALIDQAYWLKGPILGVSSRVAPGGSAFVEAVRPKGPGVVVPIVLAVYGCQTGTHYQLEIALRELQEVPA